MVQRKNLKDGYQQAIRETGVREETRVAVDLETGNILGGVEFDYIAAAYPNATTETYTYRNGGSGGDVVATVTVVYTDATKDCISTVERT